MKFTKSKLKQLVEEELNIILHEDHSDYKEKLKNKLVILKRIIGTEWSMFSRSSTGINNMLHMKPQDKKAQQIIKLLEQTNKIHKLIISKLENYK